MFMTDHAQLHVMLKMAGRSGTPQITNAGTAAKYAEQSIT